MQESNAFIENSTKCILYRYLAKPNCSKIQSNLTKPIQNNFKTHISRIRLSSYCLILKQEDTKVWEGRLDYVMFVILNKLKTSFILFFNVQ